MRVKHLLCSIVISAIAAVGVAADEIDESGGHLKIDDPAQAGNAQILAIYKDLQGRMVDGYALSDNAAAKGYAKWQRFNTAPYLSATHGNRYVNNFANRFAKGYAQISKGGRLPAGSVLAKDSFTVISDGKVFPAALFVMEKLAAGSSTKTGDWRYVMIMPDGSLYGDSAGDGAEQMEFCHDCHKIKARNDYLFYVPKAYRSAYGN